MSGCTRDLVLKRHHTQCNTISCSDLISQGQFLGTQRATTARLVTMLPAICLAAEDNEATHVLARFTDRYNIGLRSIDQQQNEHQTIRTLAARASYLQH